MGTKPRLLLAIAAIFLVCLAFSMVSVNRLVSDVTDDWARQTAEYRVVSDSERSLRPILREIELVEALATEPDLIAWAAQPDDAALRQQALRLLNKRKHNLADSSFFIALAANGQYFFNDKDNKYTGDEYRYTLDPANFDDTWFYSSLKSAQAVNVNVDYDRGLGVLKIWINVQLRAGDKVLGMLGTGFDLEAFLDSYIVRDPGTFHTLFTDADGAIQLSPDGWLIEYASFGKAKDIKTVIFDRIESSDDAAVLRQTFADAKFYPGSVQVNRINWRGETRVLGVAYIPALDWFEITVMAVEDVLPEHDLYPLYFVVIFTLVGALLALYALVMLSMIRPLDALLLRVSSIASDVEPPAKAGKLPGEFAQIDQYLTAAVADLKTQNNALSQQLHDRDLELLAANEAVLAISHVDSLTQLVHRSAFEAALMGFQKAVTEAGEQKRAALMLIEIDHFRAFNLRSGHLQGDEALRKITNVLREVITYPDSVLARYQGKVFAVLLPNVSLAAAKKLAKTLCVSVAALNIPCEDSEQGCLTVSIGLTIIGAEEPANTVSWIRNAEQALLQAERQNGNCVVANSVEKLPEDFAGL